MQDIDIEQSERNNVGKQVSESSGVGWQVCDGREEGRERARAQKRQLWKEFVMNGDVLFTHVYLQIQCRILTTMATG